MKKWLTALLFAAFTSTSFGTALQPLTAQHNRLDGRTIIVTNLVESAADNKGKALQSDEATGELKWGDMPSTNGYVIGMSQAWTNCTMDVVTNNTYVYTPWTTGQVYQDGVTCITNTGLRWTGSIWEMHVVGTRDDGTGTAAPFDGWYLATKEWSDVPADKDALRCVPDHMVFLSVEQMALLSTRTRIGGVKNVWGLAYDENVVPITRKINGEMLDHDLYITSVIEADDISKFPSPGNTNTLYMAKDKDMLYRWDAGMNNYVLVGNNDEYRKKLDLSLYVSDRFDLDVMRTESGDPTAFIRVMNSIGNYGESSEWINALVSADPNCTAIGRVIGMDVDLVTGDAKFYPTKEQAENAFEVNMLIYKTGNRVSAGRVGGRPGMATPFYLIDSSMMRNVGGVAELDDEGIIYPTQLPTKVYDLEWYPTKDDFPHFLSQISSNKIYVARDNNNMYCYDYSTYTYIPMSGSGSTTNGYYYVRGTITNYLSKVVSTNVVDTHNMFVTSKGVKKFVDDRLVLSTNNEVAVERNVGNVITGSDTNLVTDSAIKRYVDDQRYYTVDGTTTNYLDQVVSTNVVDSGTKFVTSKGVKDYVDHRLVLSTNDEVIVEQAVTNKVVDSDTHLVTAHGIKEYVDNKHLILTNGTEEISNSVTNEVVNEQLVLVNAAGIKKALDKRLVLSTNDEVYVSSAVTNEVVASDTNLVTASGIKRYVDDKSFVLTNGTQKIDQSVTNVVSDSELTLVNSKGIKTYVDENSWRVYTVDGTTTNKVDAQAYTNVAEVGASETNLVTAGGIRRAIDARLVLSTNANVNVSKSVTNEVVKSDVHLVTVGAIKEYVDALNLYLATNNTVLLSKAVNSEVTGSLTNLVTDGAVKEYVNTNRLVLSTNINVYVDRHVTNEVVASDTNLVTSSGIKRYVDSKDLILTNGTEKIEKSVTNVVTDSELTLVNSKGIKTYVDETEWKAYTVDGTTTNDVSMQVYTNVATVGTSETNLVTEGGVRRAIDDRLVLSTNLNVKVSNLVTNEVIASDTNLVTVGAIKKYVDDKDLVLTNGTQKIAKSVTNEVVNSDLVLVNSSGIKKAVDDRIVLSTNLNVKVSNLVTNEVVASDTNLVTAGGIKQYVDDKTQWGQIKGDLTNQLDLVAKLNEKRDLTNKIWQAELKSEWTFTMPDVYDATLEAILKDKTRYPDGVLYYSTSDSSWKSKLGEEVSDEYMIYYITPESDPNATSVEVVYGSTTTWISVRVVFSRTVQRKEEFVITSEMTHAITNAVKNKRDILDLDMPFCIKDEYLPIRSNGEVVKYQLIQFGNIMNIHQLDENDQPIFIIVKADVLTGAVIEEIPSFITMGDSTPAVGTVILNLPDKLALKSTVDACREKIDLAMYFTAKFDLFDIVGEVGNAVYLRAISSTDGNFYYGEQWMLALVKDDGKEFNYDSVVAIGVTDSGTKLYNSREAAEAETSLTLKVLSSGNKYTLPLLSKPSRYKAIPRLLDSSIINGMSGVAGLDMDKKLYVDQLPKEVYDLKWYMTTNDFPSVLYTSTRAKTNNFFIARDTKRIYVFDPTVTNYVDISGSKGDALLVDGSNKMKGNLNLEPGKHIVMEETDGNSGEIWQDADGTVVSSSTNSSGFGRIKFQVDTKSSDLLPDNSNVVTSNLLENVVSNRFANAIVRVNGGPERITGGVVVPFGTGETGQILMSNGTNAPPGWSSVNIQTNSGTAGQILTSNGPGVPPTWKDNSGGGLSFDDIYPVGSVYISVGATLPAAFSAEGRVWQQLAEGQFLMNTSAVGTTGGSNEKTLDATNLPHHNHGGGDLTVEESTMNFGYGSASCGPYEVSGAFESSEAGTGRPQNYDSWNSTIRKVSLNTANKWSGGTDFAGESAAFDNRPSYLGVSMWKRVH